MTPNRTLLRLHNTNFVAPESRRGVGRTTTAYMTISPNLSLVYSVNSSLHPTVRLCPSQEEVEAARAAAAPGWTGDIAWDEAVTVAMSEAPRNGETQSDREARVLKSVLEADIVPENKLGKVGAQWVSVKCARVHTRYIRRRRQAGGRGGGAQGLGVGQGTGNGSTSRAELGSIYYLVQTRSSPSTILFRSVVTVR